MGAVVKVSKPSRNITASTNYVRGRNVLELGHNVLADNAKDMMYKTLYRHGKEKGFVQAQKIIISLDAEEYPPDNPETIDKLAGMSLDLLERYEPFKDRQALIAIQNDGKGGNAHAHIIINSVHPITGRSLNGTEMSVYKIRDVADEVGKSYGIEPYERETRPREMLGMVKKRERGEYVFDDDLRETIQKVIQDESVKDFDSFKRVAGKVYGLDVKERGGKRQGLSYRFTDENKPQGARRASKLSVVIRDDEGNDIVHDYRHEGIINAINKKLEKEKLLVAKVHSFDEIREMIKKDIYKDIYIEGTPKDEEIEEIKEIKEINKELSEPLISQIEEIKPVEFKKEEEVFYLMKEKVEEFYQSMKDEPEEFSSMYFNRFTNAHELPKQTEKQKIIKLSDYVKDGYNGYIECFENVSELILRQQWLKLQEIKTNEEKKKREEEISKKLLDKTSEHIETNDFKKIQDLLKKQAYKETGRIERLSPEQEK